MSIRLDSKVAIITGAGGGIGRSHAVALSQLGAKIVVNDLGSSVDGDGKNQSLAQETVSLIKKSGGEAIANQSDISSIQGADQLVEEAHTHFGSVDILINNAGILRDGSFKNQSLDDWQKVLDVHLSGSRHVTKAVWPIMRDQKFGRIVMTTSALRTLWQLWTNQLFSGQAWYLGTGSIP